MSRAADSLQRRFGANLSESLGVRSTPPSADRFPGETGLPRTSPDDGRTRAREAGHMELDRIVPDPDQPRKEFADEAIDRLAASLLKHGQLHPLRVRWNGEIGKWVVISGERRYRAAQRAGLKTVACIFVDGALSASDILQEQMVENCLREDLKPLEQAEAYRQLMALHAWTAKQLAEELHVSEGAISKALSLLRLPEDLRTLANRGAVPATALYEVAKLPDVGTQRAIARRIETEGLKRDEVVAVVRETSGRSTRSGKGKARKMTSRTFKTAGCKVTVENKRGLDATAILSALEDAISQARAAATPQQAGLQGRGEAAA